MRRLPILCAATLVTIAACSQRVTPEEEYSEEDRDRPLVEASRFDGPAEAPRPTPPTTATEEDLDAQAIGGTIEGPERIPPGAVLYVYVRPAAATAGPPLAVQRRPSTSFPVSFSISPRDAMMGAAPFPERVSLQARLDADGDAMTTGPDDWSASADSVEPGTNGIRLELESGG